jgi:N-methylhydantoinase A
VTDADLVLGYLDPKYFLGGELLLDLNAAHVALSGLSSSLGIDRDAAAAAVHQVVNENMTGAARMHAIERGRDIRGFTLVATGGAGPVHAWGVARRLGLARILYPPAAGVASAFGMLTAPPAFDFARSLPSSLAHARWTEVRHALDSMERAGRNELGEDVSIEVSVDVRYHGQGEGITVELGGSLGGHPKRQVSEAFETAYLRLYGRKPPGVEAELLTWRVRVSGVQPTLRLSRSGVLGNALKGHRRIWSDEKSGYVRAQVWDRYRLTPRDLVNGPAVIEERESSVVIGPGGCGRLDRHGSLKVDVT